MERFRNGDVAFGVLVLLKKGNEETGKGGAGSVEGVAEVVFPVGIFEAELHATSLVVAEAGATRDFKILALTGCPYLDIVGFLRTETDITGAEFNDLVMKPEFLEGGFGMAGEFFKNIHGCVRVDDLNEFDFVELVHANDPTIVPPGASGFASEARGVAGQLDGEILFSEEGIPIEICDGNLASGNEKHHSGNDIPLCGTTTTVLLLLSTIISIILFIITTII